MTSEVRVTEQDEEAVKKAEQLAFGRRVKALRVERGWTQEQMAEYADLSSDGVRRLEYGQYNPSLATLKKVAKGLGIPIGVLIDPELDSEDVLAAFIRGLPLQLRGVAFSVIYALHHHTLSAR